MRRSTYSSSSNNVQSWLKIAAFVGVFGAFGFLMWYAGSNKDSLLADSKDVELIYPPEGPVKVRAENPGGMEVPNRDKQVFDLLAGEKTVKEADKQLCDGESSDFVCNKDVPQVTKLEPEQVAPVGGNQQVDIASLIKEIDAENAQEKKEVKSEEIKTPEPVASVKPVEPKPLVQPIVKKQVEEKVAVAKVEAKPVIQKTVEKVKVTPKPIEKKVEAVKKVVSGWGVQLASYKSMDSAKNGAKYYEKKFPTLLKPLTFKTESVDIKGKGTFYRVQFLGATSKAKAQAICTTIKAKGESCFHVKR